jgi:hypothetical protein
MLAASQALTLSIAIGWNANGADRVERRHRRRLLPLGRVYDRGA